MSTSIKLLTACSAVLAASTAQAALIGYWNFNEGSGTTALDASGNGHNGTINGATYVSGKAGFGTALDFNNPNNGAGNSQYVYVGAMNSALELVQSAYTITWWMKWDGVGGDNAAQRMINMDDCLDVSGGYSQTLTTASHYNFSSHVAGSGYGSYFPGNSTAVDGVWRHMAVTVGANKVRSFYIDGVLQGTNTVDNLLYSDHDDPLLFGAYWSGSAYGQFYNGALDEIRIYNEALSSAQIATLVPEPTSLGLVLSLGGLMLARARKRSS